MSVILPRVRAPNALLLDYGQALTYVGKQRNLWIADPLEVITSWLESKS